ncbi:MAG TPA: HEAT repeat domain-containing protein [Longimicrobiaceae bacterium]|nr:HEAT repeat domain-containing protein [Longimicrobiaceae bacterium]
MSVPPVLIGWIVTYALHSTILLGFVLLVSRRVDSDAWRETLWKTALLGGLLTATFQTAAGYTPLVGRWAIENDAAASPATPSVAGPADRPEERGPERRGDASGGGPVSRAGGAAADERTGAAPPAISTPAAQGPRAAAPERGIPWVPLLGGVWMAVAGLLLGRLVLQHVWLFRALADRKPITEGPLPGMLSALRRHAGFWAPVRLTVSAACPTPIALGRSEVCVPERFLTELEAEQQRTALAHELAHLQRSDPVWQLSAGIIESVFFFQPLNRVARQHLRDAAENLCDDRAVRLTGSALGLARCLTNIASWVSPTTIPEATLAMAEGGSPLLRRVERLAEWREPPMYAAQFRSLASAGLLALVALVAPAVSQSAQPADPPASASRAAAARPGSPSGARDSVIVHPDPSAPLAARWQWALDQELPGGFWIAWGGEGGVRTRDGGTSRVVVLNGSHMVIDGDGAISSNSPGPGSHTPDAPSLREILPGAVPPVAFVFGFAGEGNHSEDVDWIRLRSAGAPLDLGGRPLVWLGPASTPESLAQLRRLHAALRDPALRKEVAAAFSLHEGQREVVRAVRETVGSEESATVRAEAVQWLPRGQSGGAEMIELLTQVALTDPSPRVRDEAVSALGQIGSPEARAVLMRLARTAPHADVRREAIDHLGDSELLRQLVRDAPEDVRGEAVEALASEGSEQIVPALVTVAFEDPADAVRREAVDALALLPFDSARRALLRIVNTHPDPKIRAEAVQALARRD